MDARIAFPFDNTYARDLADLGVPWGPAPASAPRLLHFDEALASELGLPVDAMDDETRAAIFSGNLVPGGAQPFAQVYAGHQFGGWSPRLGDGRALLLGEVIDSRGHRRDIAFKGSGRTPFARGGDGKAAVGPMLREVLISEWMHAAGIPTTRSLAVVATGDAVMREQVLPGAVLTRVAASHLRVGTFEYVAAGGSEEQVGRLLAYAIARHYPEVGAMAGGARESSSDGAGGAKATPTSEQALAFLAAVVDRQARLVAMWMNAGFIHGVMNTDNMTISGETIDYGPCAFLEAYDPATVFSSIDTQGRYAFGNQPRIAPWNLARLAEAILPLVDSDGDEAVRKVMPLLEGFSELFREYRLDGQRVKLGLEGAASAEDEALVRDWLALLEEHRVDHTLAWRRLADVAEGDELALRGLFIDQQAPSGWLAQWKARRAMGGASPDAMRVASPFVIPRNHKVEEALAAATNEGDLAPFRLMLAALRTPFDETPATAAFGIPAPAATTASYKTFCGT